MHMPLTNTFTFLSRSLCAYVWSSVNDFIFYFWGFQMFLHENPKEESIMDILNIVFSALNLLATVIIGVIQVTWMISRDVFRDKPRAKHYSHSKK